MTVLAPLALLRRRPAEIACVLACGALVVLWLRDVLAGAGAFGLPLDDSYIYLTYARQIARGRPFTYFDGSGYSAGATSVLWPVAIAPLWAVGFRGERLVIAVVGLGAILLASTAILGCAIGRRTTGTAGGFCGAMMMLACGPLVWGYLSGMEVGLSATATLAAVWFLIRHGGQPSAAVVLTLAAATLTRPETGVWAAGVVLAAAVRSWRRREPRAAGRFLLALVPALLFACLNRALAGHFVPNTAVAKSHFYQAGFDLAYFVDAVADQTAAFGRALIGYRGASAPFPYASLVLLLYAIGAWRAGRAARRHPPVAFGVAALVAAPAVVWLTTIAASGHWSFQNYRYISASFAPLLLVAGMAFGRASAVSAGRRSDLWFMVPVLVLVAAALPSLRDQARLFAQGVRDTNAQVVAIGRWIDANLPARVTVAVHDVGAIGYFGRRPLFDVIGLVTNHQADDGNDGAGSRFEALERLAPSARPRYFVYYPGWLLAGAGDLFGATLFTADLRPPIAPGLAGGWSMKVFVADWTIARSGEAPLADHAGFVVRDTLDVADLESEREHGYVADYGRRAFGDNTDRFSVFHSMRDGSRPVADGGRTIRGPRGEHFRLATTPGRRTRLLVRVGGPQSLPFSELPARPQPLVVRARGIEVGRIAQPAPGVAFHDLALDIDPAYTSVGSLDLHVSASGGEPYRTYHYFLLEAERPVH